MSDTIRFTTSPEGYPGSPSHVTTQGLYDNAVLICWDSSLVGAPFSEHTISWVTTNGTTVTLILGEANLETDECALGATVSWQMCVYPPPPPSTTPFLPHYLHSFPHYPPMSSPFFPIFPSTPPTTCSDFGIRLVPRLSYILHHYSTHTI